MHCIYKCLTSGTYMFIYQAISRNPKIYECPNLQYSPLGLFVSISFEVPKLYLRNNEYEKCFFLIHETLIDALTIFFQINLFLTPLFGNVFLLGTNSSSCFTVNNN